MRSGKTERMLNDVFDQLKPGAYVFVIAANAEQRRWLASRIMEKCGGEPGARLLGDQKIYFANGSQISLETVKTVNVDWVTGNIQGAHSSCEVFADHFAVEQQFPWAWRQLRVEE